MSGETLRYSTSTPVTVEPDNPLTILIHRLEAATSRLEDIASSSSSFEQQQQQQAGGQQNVAAAGGSISQSPQEGTSKAGTREGSTGTVVRENLPPAIEDMDALINGDVKAFVESSRGLDSVVEEQVSRHHSANGEMIRTDEDDVGRACRKSLRGPAPIPGHSNAVEEAGYTIEGIYGPPDRSAARYGQRG